MIIKMRYERLNRNWTQEEVAEQVGITKQAIQQFETKQIKPSFEVLVKLENLFGMSYRELFKDTDTA